MIDLSPVKILVVLVVALLVLGPEKLPRLARQLGGALAELRRVRDGIRNELTGVVSQHVTFSELRPTSAPIDPTASEPGMTNRAAGDPSEGSDLISEGDADEHHTSAPPAVQVTEHFDPTLN